MVGGGGQGNGIAYGRDGYFEVPKLPVTAATNIEPCEKFCPILKHDKQGVEFGYPQAQGDLDRHRIEANMCSGAEVNAARCVVKCALFGAEANL